MYFTIHSHRTDVAKHMVPLCLTVFHFPAVLRGEEKRKLATVYMQFQWRTHDSLSPETLSVWFWKC